MKTKLLCWVLIVTGQLSYAQTFSEVVTRDLTFGKRSDDNALIVANLQGSVKVVSHAGDNILLEVTKSIRAKTDARLEKGKSEIQLGIIDRADTLILFVLDGCHQFRENAREHSGWDHLGWSYQSLTEDGCDPGYRYRMDFILKVPKALHLLVSTVNEGDVVVEDIDGVVRVRNVNGNIRLSNLKNAADAHTINGDVDIQYAGNPEKECRFYTLNGDINALFQPGLSANVSFESFNGSLYTNITKMENLPLKLEKSNKGEGLRYKINGSRYQVGRGGALLDFETFNGNVYLKEKTQ